MSPDDLTPERLDAILNGSEPAESDPERDMLALAASLRDGSPRAGGELRERVRAIAASGREPRQRGPGWRTRFLIAGPAVAMVVAAVVVIAVVGRDDPGTNRTSLTTPQSALSGAVTTPVAPSAARSSADAEQAVPSSTAPPAATVGPVIVRVDPGSLPRRLADAQRIVAAAGGAVVVTRQTGRDPSALLAITLPADRVSGVLAKLTRLGEGRGGSAIGTDGTLRLLLTEGRSH